jgi:hypothetical protein
MSAAGINLLSGKSGDASTLPLYSTSTTVVPTASGQGLRYTLSILKTVVKQIVEKSASRRIFGMYIFV